MNINSFIYIDIRKMNEKIAMIPAVSSMASLLVHIINVLQMMHIYCLIRLHSVRTVRL